MAQSDGVVLYHTDEDLCGQKCPTLTEMVAMHVHVSSTSL